LLLFSLRFGQVVDHSNIDTSGMPGSVHLTCGQIKAAARTPGQTSPAVQFRDIECPAPVTTLTSGYRPGAAGAPAGPARAGWPGWAAGVLLGTGPFVAYVASRTVGVPGDPSDVGNWGDWVGTASLVVEAALIALSASTLLALRQRLSYPVR
jgi:hypothetical protein